MSSLKYTQLFPTNKMKIRNNKHDQHVRNKCQLQFCKVPGHTSVNQKQPWKLNLFIENLGNAWRLLQIVNEAESPSLSTKKCQLRKPKFTNKSFVICTCQLTNLVLPWPWTALAINLMDGSWRVWLTHRCHGVSSRDGTRNSQGSIFKTSVRGSIRAL